MERQRLRKPGSNGKQSGLALARTRSSPGIGALSHGHGNPLAPPEREYFEPRFGYDLSKVRVYADEEAATSARGFGARAYTVGRDITFAAGQYQPGTHEGRRLLAHELTHTLQQGQRGTNADLAHPLPVSAPGDSAEREAAQTADRIMGGDYWGGGAHVPRVMSPATMPTMIQRDLLAYAGKHEELLPTSPEAAAVLYNVYAADAADIKRALQPLLTAGKLGARVTGDGVIFFNQGAASADILAALTAAGYPRAVDMTAALMDEHQISIYTRERVTKMSGLFTQTIDRSKQVIEGMGPRPLTAGERREAQLVFGASMDYDRISVDEDPVMSVGGYARTTPWTINFPAGSFGRSDFMSWLIHELTHSWQYQHGVSLKTTFWTSLTGTYDYGGEAGLKAAQAAGRSFRSFNTEQQGDILEDYYKRLKGGMNVAAWQPFVNEVQSLPPS